VQAQSAPAPEVILTEIQQGLARAWVAGDRAFIEQTIAPDWTAVGPMGASTTRADLLAPMFEQRIQQVQEMVIDDVRVRVFGATAIVTGRTHVVGTIGGAPYDARLRFTDVFVLRGGRWQAIASHGSLTN